MKRVITMSQSKLGRQTPCVCKGKSIKERFEYFQKDLTAIQTGNKKRQKDILERADPCLVKLLCEVSLNVLKENIQLPQGQYEVLKPHKQLLLKICQRRLTLKQRQKLLLKAIGGFLPKIRPGIISAIVGQAVLRAI